MSRSRPCGNWRRFSKTTRIYSLKSYIVLDVLIGHAVRMAWVDGHPERVGLL
jgi:hypothetical protein